MTIVEFFDKNALDNIASSLVCSQCDRVIFVGNNGKKIARAIEGYKEVCARHGATTDISFLTANKNQLSSVLSVLEKIISENDDVVFDLSGGDDLFLVGVGVMMEKYREKVKCHRYNVRTDSLVDCDLNGHECQSREIKLSCDDCVTLYGGTNSGKDNWIVDKEFARDITSLWEIYKKCGKMWNTHSACLSNICANLPSSDPLLVEFERAVGESVLESFGYKFALEGWVLKEIEKCGLIKNLIFGSSVSFEFKNEQIKKCLTTAGQVLELFVASRLLQCTEKGESVYNDVRVGVMLNWESGDDDEIKTLNEVDVFAMRGFVPVFISCKNGNFDVNELYKLSSVADKFGYHYAKKVVVTTELDALGVKGDYIRERAEDMEIKIIDKIEEMSLEEINRAFKILWSH